MVHALVIMNIADHCNRAKYLGNEIVGKLNRVLGVILGKLDGKSMDLSNTIEIKYKVNKGKIVVDEAFLVRRLQAYKKMFPNLDCVGWYSAGAA